MLDIKDIDKKFWETVQKEREQASRRKAQTKKHFKGSQKCNTNMK